MEYSITNISKIAWRIVEDMTRRDLEIFAYEEQYARMDKEEEIFDQNVEIYGEE